MGFPFSNRKCKLEPFHEEWLLTFQENVLLYRLLTQAEQERARQTVRFLT